MYYCHFTFVTIMTDKKIFTSCNNEGNLGNFFIFNFNLYIKTNLLCEFIKETIYTCQDCPMADG